MGTLITMPTVWTWYPRALDIETVVILMVLVATTKHISIVTLPN